MMSKEVFLKLVDYMVETYGVQSYRDNPDDVEEESYWVQCPCECQEPILYEDWADDLELQNGFCPICGERLWEDGDLD